MVLRVWRVMKIAIVGEKTKLNEVANFVFDRYANFFCKCRLAL